MPSVCAKCAQPAADGAALKQCGACKSQPYCSRECQVADWPAHKPACQRATGTGPAPAPGSASTFNTRPTVTGFSLASASGQSLLAALNSPSGAGGLLDPALPEQTVYRHLIDAFRMRCEDEYTFTGELIGLYNDNDHAGARREFERFLDAAEGKVGRRGKGKGKSKGKGKGANTDAGAGTGREASTAHLPGWWNAGKRQACLRAARDTNGEARIYHAVEKHDVQKAYEDSLMPMKLRLLADEIYGRPVGQWYE
jgi:splicing suppressor protein 51